MPRRLLTMGVLSLLIVSMMAISAPAAGAVTDCAFTMSGNKMVLEGDCTTDETIGIPDGYTLAGNRHTITAVDPPGGNFTGAVVQNDGSTAHVTDLTIRAATLANVGEGGADRLRGIYFNEASGSITHTTVLDINKGASGSQEGNAVEVRNQGSGAQSVEVSHTTIDDYQKTGIAIIGDVDASVHHNKVGDSATQENLGANGIQLSQGASGTVSHNHVEGNQWFGPSNYAAAAILVILTDGVEVSKNNIRGNSDIGIAVLGTDIAVDNNRIFDRGKDGPHGDFGVAVYPGSGDVDVTKNKARGFDTPYYGVSGGKNKAIPGPQPGNPWF